MGLILENQCQFAILMEVLFRRRRVFVFLLYQCPHFSSYIEWDFLRHLLSVSVVMAGLSSWLEVLSRIQGEYCSSSS